MDKQAEFLDWVFTDDSNVFRNKNTGEIVFVQAPKRGNAPYARKKNATLDTIIRALADNQFDYEVPGTRGGEYRMTHMLFFTGTFSHERYTPEQAWGCMRSTDLEEAEFEHGAMNKLGANFSSIFGKNGKLTCKEASSSGYPAPHVILVLDKPVLVKRFVSRTGEVSWRIVDKSILKRLGKDFCSRQRSKCDVEAASAENPIWPYGTFDIKGLVKHDRFNKFSNGFTYVFKYLIKTITINKYPELMEADSIEEVRDKSLRTMLYTHYGNKCFRTRDIVFGKAFKDRMYMLPEETEEEKESEWERIRTIPKWVADKIMETKAARSGMKNEDEG